jgi:hypothetical protein
VLPAAVSARAATLDNVRQRGLVACGVNTGLGGFLRIRKDARIGGLKELGGGTIFMPTLELNLADRMKPHGIAFHVVLLDTIDMLIKTLLSNRGDAASFDSSKLASIRAAGSALKLERGRHALWTRDGLVSAVAFR